MNNHKYRIAPLSDILVFETMSELCQIFEAFSPDRAEKVQGWVNQQTTQIIVIGYVVKSLQLKITVQVVFFDFHRDAFCSLLLSYVKKIRLFFLFLINSWCHLIFKNIMRRNESDRKTDFSRCRVMSQQLGANAQVLQLYFKLKVLRTWIVELSFEFCLLCLFSRTNRWLFNSSWCDTQK